MNTDLIAYYAARAAGYEKIYDRPERQQDLARLTAILQDLFRNRTLLEIACGTGWWTQRLAQTAHSILATDVNEAVLDIARAKEYPGDTVAFRQDDLFHSGIDEQFDAVFGGFIWSHLLLDQIDPALEQVARRLNPGGMLVFVDNCLVPGSSTPISRTDEAGNTYQIRRLEDGSEHLVLKNFPEPEFVKQKLQRIGLQPEVVVLEYYWMAVVKTFP